MGHYLHIALSLTFGKRHHPLTNALEVESDLLGSHYQPPNPQMVQAGRQMGRFNLNLVVPTINTNPQAGLEDHKHRTRRPSLGNTSNRISNGVIAWKTLKAAEQFRQPHSKMH